MAARGIRLTVLRSTYGDCTNGGITESVHSVVLIDDRIPERERNTEPSAHTPAVRLTETATDYPVLVPISSPAASKVIGPMAGGNYAIGQYDSRATWQRLVGVGAIPVHDRFETQADYNALST